MVGKDLDYSTLFTKDLPSTAGRWQGHPKYNFIGGHYDPELQPMEQFMESAAKVFRGDPRRSGGCRQLHPPLFRPSY